jgi:hypothetical protein|tara:strand:- start:228 stop:2687 length:2460 start_codon:yes stop_codon:yes gene_type:complete
MSTYSDLKGGSAGSATTVYSTIGDLPLSDNLAGTQAYVSGTNRLYIWNGTGWFNIALINTNPEITTGGAASYALASDGTATEITLVANDPEGLPIAWNYAVTAGSIGSTASVSQNNNVFTITPSTDSANGGDFTITFTASDGVNLATSASQFSLAFVVHNSRYTSLSLQAASTGTNSTFVDSSSEGNTITNSGTVAGTFSPYRDQGYSAHFGNNDAGITIAASSHLGIQGSDFCIEAWVKPTSKIDPYPRIFNGGAANWSTNDSWALLCGHDDAGHGSGTKYSFAAVAISGNNAVLTSTTSIDFGGDWQHVCVTRNGTTLSLYINGTREDTATTSSNINSSATNALSIGRNGDTNSSYHGYMRDIRIIKGSAFRDVSGSGSFDVPTEKLTNVSGTGYTTSLLTCQGNKLTDSGAGNLGLAVQAGVSMEPITPYDSSGGYTEIAHGSSGSFGGNDNIRSTTVDLPTGGEAYTIEAWVYATSTARGTIANWGAQGTSQATSLRLNDAGNGFSHIWYAANLETNDIGVRPNVWYHVAGTYDGTTRRIFVNGVQRAQDTPGNHTTSVTNNFTIGEAFYSGANYMNGYISDLRISDIARYSSGFSVPTAPHTADANTVFLLNPNPSIIDKAQGSNITLVGDASGSNTQQLFSTSTIAFDGVGDYLVASSSSTAYGYGTLDFTIEFWVYFNSTGITQTVVSSLTSASSTNPHLYLLGTDSTLRYYTASGERISSSALSSGTWYHVALSRASGSTKLFIDGTQSGSTYTDSNNYGSPAPFVFGTHYNAGSLVTTNPLSGYVQDVRVTKGLARYTSNFTPPTALLEG